MRTGLKNVKLILLGLVTIAAPLLFILQADTNDKRKDDLAKAIKTTDSLKASNIQKDLLISFFQQQATKQQDFDTSKLRINFNPTIQTPQPKDYSQPLQDLNRTLENIQNEIKNRGTQPLQPPTSNKSFQSTFVDSAKYFTRIIDSLIKVVRLNDAITKDALAKSEIIEQRVLSICRVENKTRRRNLPELIKQINSLCNLVDSVNSQAKWRNILK